VGPVSEGGFSSVDTGGPADINNTGYAGVSVGYGRGPSLVGYGNTVTNYDYFNK
jgi:hypothetical protein